MAKNKKNSQGTELEDRLDNSTESKKEQKGNLAFKITALSLAAVMVILIVVGLVVSLTGDNGVRLDYMNDRLSKYVTMSKSDYTGYKVTVNIPAPGEQELNDAIIAVLYNNREVPEGDPVYLKNADISAGDAVNIYYRGYTINDDGSKNYFDGGCNFNSAKPATLEIGSGSFVSGFEYNLIGKNQKKQATMTKVTEGAVKADDVLLITYSVAYGDGSKLSSQSAIIDLSDPNLDKKWGEGFSAYWKSNDITIGNTYTITTKSVKENAAKEDVYSEVSVSEIYRVNATEERPVLIIEAKFPHDYQEESLQNKKAYFETYILSIQDCTVPELDEKFVTETLKITADDLKEYEGDDIVAKYKNSLLAKLNEEHEQSINDAIATEFWKHIVAAADFKKLPSGDVQDYYSSMYAEIESAYSQYQSYYNSIDTFAIAYMGLSSSDDWKASLYASAEESTKQKLAFYYIIREENFIPTAAEYQVLYDEMYNEQLEAYLEYYGIEETDEDYAEKLESAKSTINGMYDEEYWENQILFAYGIEKICALADLTNKAEAK